MIKIFKNMKAFFLKILFLFNFIVSIKCFLFAQFGGGTGTELDPYRIYTKAHLEELSDSIVANNVFDGKHFKLMNNINDSLTKTIGYPPSPEDRFQGVFHGCGNYITVNFVETQDYDVFKNRSLFYMLGQNAVIDSLTIEGYMFKTFGFAYASSGKISNCTNNIITSSELSTDYDLVRTWCGICHDNCFDGLITNCINNANLYNGYAMGGLVCSNAGTISQCTNNGNLFGVNTTEVMGGICCNNAPSALIINCINNGNLTYTEESAPYITYGGGVCARSSGEIINCINNGSILHKDYVYTAGISGIIKTGKILNCANYGNISGRNYIGGIAGGYYAQHIPSLTDTIGTVIKNCFNSGEILADSLAYGIRGDMMYKDSILNCLNISKITGSAITDTSSNENTYISNNYYDKQMSPNSFGIGSIDVDSLAEGKLTTQLTGTSPELQAMLGDGWSYAEGRYPIPLGLENHPAALLAATPVYLPYTDQDDYNTVDSVTCHFMLGTENNVEWECPSSTVNLEETEDGLKGVLQTSGNANLVASLGGFYKNIFLNIKSICDPVYKNEEIQKTQAIAYPNPTKDMLYFNQASAYEIYDLQGKLIMKSKKPQNSVNTSELKPGVYLIKVGEKVMKFVVE